MLAGCRQQIGPHFALDKNARTRLVVVHEAAGCTRKIVGQPLLQQPAMPYVLPESASAFGPAGYGHVRKQHGFTLIKQALHQRLRGAHFTPADRMHPYRLLHGAWAAVPPKARTRAHAPGASGT